MTSSLSSFSANFGNSNNKDKSCFISAALPYLPLCHQPSQLQSSITNTRRTSTNYRVPKRLRASHSTFIGQHPHRLIDEQSQLLPIDERTGTATGTTTMGIKGLSKLLGDNAPSCIKPQEAQSLFGRKLAIDASMCIYQLLVAVRVQSDNLTNEQGTVTSHLSGLFYRTIKLLELGIKPVYVFDGAPPKMKGGELSKRAEAKKQAEEAVQKAKDEGDLETMAKFQRRINKITPEMISDCKTLLSLMGIPVVQAPSEAEAQCAELVKKDLVYATVSEDMDSLTFGTNRLVRHLWSGISSSANKKGIKPTEYILENALTELDLSMDRFIDMCILCGCDYVDSIKGVGVVKALNMVKKHGDLHEIVPMLRKEKGFQVPEEYPIDELRNMFIKADVTPAEEFELKWVKPKHDELRKFMVEDNQFDTLKVDNGLKRLVASRKVSSQVRVDSFFTKKATTPVKKKEGAKTTTPSKTSTPSKKRPSTATTKSTTPNKKQKKT